MSNCHLALHRKQYHVAAMSDQIDSIDLNGKLLIAMPGMGDPRFCKKRGFSCVPILMKARWGLSSTKPTPDLLLDDLLEQLGISKGTGARGHSGFLWRSG